MKTDMVGKKRFYINGNIKSGKNISGEKIIHRGVSDESIKCNKISGNIFTRKNILIILMIFGCMMGSFSHTAFSSMLENIMKEFNLSAEKSQWMTAVYSMTIGVTTVLSVFLTKNFERKKLFFISMTVFAFGIILSALSFNYLFIIIGRIIQAVGSGIVLTLSQVVLLSAYSKEKTGIVMGIYGFLLNLSSAIAPVVTLLLIRKISWQIIMWGIFGLVIVILAIQIGLYILGRKQSENYITDNNKKQNLENYFEDKEIQSSLDCFEKHTSVLKYIDAEIIKVNIKQVFKKFKKFDFISFALSGISIVLFMVSFTSIKENNSSFGMIKSILFIVTGSIFMIIFIRRQLKAKEPYINLKIFKNKKFMIVVLTSIFIYAVMMGTAVWFPVYIKRIAEADMQRVGMIMLPGALLMAVSSALGGWLYQKYGIRIIYAVSICSFVVAILTRNIVPLWVLFSMRSVGIGIIMMSMVAWGMKDIEKDSYSDGTAVICSLRTVAGAFGTALAAMLM